MRSLRIAVLVMLTAGLMAGCGGGGGSANTDESANGSGNGGAANLPSGSNVQPISVNLGPTGNYANGIFTSVRVCTPGSTTNCQTIDNVLVDTGSYGLRLLGSALTNVSLPQQTNGAGGNTGECTVFAEGYTWGPVVTADIQIAGETAYTVPVAVIGSYSYLPSFPSAPSACSQAAKTDDGATQLEDDSLATLGANGILGIGVFPQDCGPNCPASGDDDPYFVCTSSLSSSCTTTSQSVQNQVQNPVALFTSTGDNNGVQIQLPSISASGATTVSGVLIFGIGTQANNGLESAQVLVADSGYGDITTSFNGHAYTDASFIDSGSNGLYFSDASIPQCSGNYAGFYCPTAQTPPPPAATMSGMQSGTPVISVPFSVANADTLLSSNYAAFNDLAGTNGSGLSGDFDWGLPFFYGRNVYFGLYDPSAPAGTTPYYAY